jgi:hypothetical protein
MCGLPLQKTEKVVATGDEVSIADRTNIAFMGTLVRYAWGIFGWYILYG